MKFIAKLFAMVFIYMLSTNVQAYGPKVFGKNHSEAAYLSNPVFSDDEIRNRLNQLSGNIEFSYNAEVRKHIYRYTVSQRKQTSKLLDKTQLFFPLFESIFSSHGIPTELKCLSIVESSLRPDATSRVGAAGLWQFMRGTGREFGLKITNYIDERRDPVKSTKAAAEYLKELHEQFGDWNLALAAYNCGPGRVRKAIRQARSKDFWVLRKYLPKETRNYVPAFIAANYIANYYALHDIFPENQIDQELVYTQSTKIYKGSSFKDISTKSGVAVAVIKFLNPSYIKNYIPKSQNGYNLRLPYHAMTAFQVKANPQTYAFNASLNTVQQNFGIERTRKKLAQPQELDFARRLFAVEEKALEISVNRKKLLNKASSDLEAYRMTKNESIMDIANKHDHISLEDLLSYNEIDLKEPPMPGSIIMIPKQ